MQTRAAYVAEHAKSKWPWPALCLFHVSKLADGHVNQSHSPGSLSPRLGSSYTALSIILSSVRINWLLRWMLFLYNLHANNFKCCEKILSYKQLCSLKFSLRFLLVTETLKQTYQANAASQLLSHSRARVSLFRPLLLLWYIVNVNKNVIKRVNYIFLWELRNVMPVIDLFRKSLPLPHALPKPTKLLFRRHHGWRSCIPGLEGTLIPS
jgi:hypothetical protein